MRVLSGVLAVIVACSTACNSLHIPPSKHRNKLLGHASFHRSAVTTPLRAESAGVTNEKSETTLTLKGEFSVSTSDLPKTSIEDAVAFFRTTEARNLFMSSGGEKPCRELATVTPLQLEDWNTRCLALGACPPNENDPILSVVTQGIQFPGLKVESNALIGSKYVETDDNSSKTVPRYEFVLLDTEQIVSGIAPAVWIFNKLTGGSTDSTSFESLSTVTLEDHKSTVLVRSNALLSLGVSFPRLLLKILPGDQQTIEERGGKSITKALVRDVSKSVKAFETAYREKFGV